MVVQDWFDWVQLFFDMFEDLVCQVDLDLVEVICCFVNMEEFCEGLFYYSVVLLNDVLWWGMVGVVFC